MARATHRRRPDGIIEIVTERRAGLGALETAATIAAAFAAVLVLSAVFAVYVMIGLPLVLACAVVFAVLFARRRLRRPPSPARLRPVPDGTARGGARAGA